MVKKCYEAPVLEVFDIEMHTVAPVVAGIGGDIDALGISILQA